MINQLKPYLTALIGTILLQEINILKLLDHPSIAASIVRPFDGAGIGKLVQIELATYSTDAGDLAVFAAAPGQVS